MANKKKEVYHVKPLNENKKNIIAALIDEYDIQTADDIQEALKDLLGGTIKSMMEAEMDEHLGYESYERSDNENYRNGTKKKRVRGNYGEFEIDVPQDRNSTFELSTPIYKFSADVRKVIYTTNAIESLNSTYKKFNRQRSVFPSDTALLKSLYLSTLQATKKMESTS